eukprot:837690-Prymnesium_polylepis.1
MLHAFVNETNDILNKAIHSHLVEEHSEPELRTLQAEVRGARAGQQAHQGLEGGGRCESAHLRRDGWQTAAGERAQAEDPPARSDAALRPREADAAAVRADGGQRSRPRAADAHQPGSMF